MKEATTKHTSRDKLLDVTFEEVYKYGYCGAGTASILKKASVPKGSMYHHFKSKKEMVLAMIEERLIPKVREFFDFEIKKDSTALDVLTQTLKKISKNKMLVMHGCPLHRLMFEMEALDEDIASACEKEFEVLTNNLATVLELGMKEGNIQKDDPKTLAEFFVASSWGLLSRPISTSSEEQFLKDSTLLLNSIKS
jgi:TetR/AcrR family transcriptional repressor of nem operon